MFNLNRIIGAAIGLMALCCASSAQDIKMQDSGGAGKTNAASNKSGNFCGASFTMDCGRNDIDPDIYYEDRNEREKGDLKAQKSVADSTEKIVDITIWQMWISIAGIALLLWSLYQTRTAIKDTREIGEAQVRAYLTPATSREQSAIELEWNGTNDASHPLEIKNIRVRWKNTGQSPAISVALQTVIYAVDPEKTEPVLSIAERKFIEHKVGAYSVPASGTILCESTDPENPFRITFRAEDVTRWKADNIWLVIHSMVTYKDVFGKTVKIQDCSRAVWVANKTLVRFKHYSHHNGMTLPS